jgi:hypothetical protein
MDTRGNRNRVATAAMADIVRREKVSNRRMRESVREGRDEEAFYDAGELRTVLPMPQP